MINLIYPLISMIFFSLLFLTYKKSELKSSNKYTVNFGLFLSGLVLSLLLIFFAGGIYDKSVSLAGFVAGVSASLAVILFLDSLRFYKLNVSTTIINLSFMIPVIFSIIAWNEIPNITEIFSVILVAASIILIKNG